MTKKCDLLIINANEVVTVEGNSQKPKIKEELSELGIIENGAVACAGEKIVKVGKTEDVINHVDTMPDTKIIDAKGKIVLPGLVDPHTHIIFGESREKELGLRLQGADYLEILKAGGGILGTVESTRAASFEELYYSGKNRLDKFLEHGVTTIETKSGYGLTTEDEIKQLKVAKSLDKIHPVDIVRTFLGAHAIPKEYKEKSDVYVDIVIEEMLPRVKEEGLAEFCDVFCEDSVFSKVQSEKILNKAKEFGLDIKLHADEIVPLGGAELAAKLKAVSADHLLKASDEGIEAMAKEGVIGVLLPGTAFFLISKEYARGREMIEKGVPIALSTDRNPGSSPTEAINLVMTLACLNMKLSVKEVISACTINAAHAINRADRIGSLEGGKQADIVIFDAPNHEYLPYHYGINHVEKVIKKGKLIK